MQPRQAQGHRDTGSTTTEAHGECGLGAGASGGRQDAHSGISPGPARLHIGLATPDPAWCGAWSVDGDVLSSDADGRGLAETVAQARLERGAAGVTLRLDDIAEAALNDQLASFLLAPPAWLAVVAVERRLDCSRPLDRLILELCVSLSRKAPPED